MICILLRKTKKTVVSYKHAYPKQRIIGFVQFQC